MIFRTTCIDFAPPTPLDSFVNVEGRTFLKSWPASSHFLASPSPRTKANFWMEKWYIRRPAPPPRFINVEFWILTPYVKLNLNISTFFIYTPKFDPACSVTQYFAMVGTKRNLICELIGNFSNRETESNGSTLWHMVAKNRAWCRISYF